MESTASFEARVDAAIQALEGGKPLQGSVELPQRINERLAFAGEVANIRSAQVDRHMLHQVNQLLTQAQSARTRSKRFQWLKRAADKFSAAVAPHAACKKGCSHCCHIPLKITEAEAIELGNAISVVPSPEATNRPEREDGIAPCTFLRDGECSIYLHRPIVCRSHFNLDADDLLCQIVPGVAIPVPYVDNRAILMGTLIAGGASPRIADIRNWFPSGFPGVGAGPDLSHIPNRE